MPERQYLLPVRLDTRIRHYHRTESGRVVEFLVQLEIKVAGFWRVAIRYDTAHGFTHIDRYNQKGEARKEVLKLSYSEALTRAERDIRGNWSIYRHRFLRGGFP